MGHRSPSRSADLDKFTSGEDLKLGTDVRPREAGETRDSWEASESVTVTSNRLSVYTSISSLPSLANTDSSAKSASENDDQSTPVRNRKLPHGSLRVAIPKGISNQMSELSLQNSAEEPAPFSTLLGYSPLPQICWRLCNNGGTSPLPKN